MNKPLSNIEVRGNHGFLIVGIRHADGSLTLNAKTDTKLTQGDVVIVLGHKSDIPQLAAKFSARANVLTYRGVKVET